MARRRPHGRRSSAWIRPGKRWRIYARDGHVCVWCGERPEVFTLDHLFPTHSRWRDNDPRRLVTACLSCNLSRKAQGVATWLRTLRADLFADWRGALARLRAARTTPLPPVAERPGALEPWSLPASWAEGVYGLGADGNLY